jgi:HSP20 family protein
MRNQVAGHNEAANPLAALRQEMDNMFEDFFEGFSIEPLGGMSKNRGFMPRINVSEDEKAMEISAELPGMDEKDIELTLNDGALTIKGEKKSEHESKEKNFYRVERSYGSFQRTIPLGSQIDESKVDANFKKGVLKVTLPKVIEAKPAAKKINISGE